MQHLFGLDEPSETVAGGDATMVYTERGTAWAKMESLGGATDGLAISAGYRITIYYRTDITLRHGWRLSLRGTIRKFLIEGQPVDPDGRKREIVIQANEIVVPERVS